MNHSRKCVLCHRLEETKTTGPLSKKEQVTAHQNCLLFASGIFCTDTPQFDDLFGFSVEHVQEEVKRGSKLLCKRCKKKGATAGCEVKRCKKTFHYPCAMEEGATTFEDNENGKFELYCRLHSDPENRKPKTSRPKNPNKAGSSKTYCLTCERKEGNISLDSLSNSIDVLCPACSSITADESQRDADGVSRRKSVKKSRMLSDDSSDTDEEGLMPPLESDFEESATFVQEHELSRHSSAGSQKNLRVPQQDAESESLLSPVADGAEFYPDPSPRSVTDERLQVQLMEKAVQTIKRENPKSRPEQQEEHVSGSSVPHQSAAALYPYPERSSSAPSYTSSNFTATPPRADCATIISPPPRSSAPHSPHTPPRSERSSTRAPPSPAVDSAGFWRSCNAAGCTQAIFTEFIREINNISSRIQSDQASQEGEEKRAKHNYSGKVYR
ncbi:hypothetical protein CCH79_00002586 [Gambusia affinis]|uniref:PHD-type domain-containing protein n=1 Tax=Gambusia affinis TaxID=33528 RepID=A0A315W6I9_GAMAF|nr:hypothetical protein CCH79_00002586 [Gambusia affinis]